MPGFVIAANGSPMGGQAGETRQHGRRQYYYNYFWEIPNLFETNFSSDALVGLKDATLPTMTVNKEVYAASSLEYKFAKSVTWEDVKVTWYDSEGLLGFIRTWRQTVWRPETGLQPASDYKKNSTIHYFLPTGERQNRWDLINSWPSQIRHGELTYTSSDVKIIEVTVTYDWAEETPG